VVRVFVAIAILALFFIAAKFVSRTISSVTASASDLISQTVDLATPKSVLIARQNALQAQKSQIAQQLSGMQLMEDENNSLRQLLDYPKLATATIAARIISKPSQNIYDRIMIDRGARDGVVVGDKIIAGENSYLATIDKVTEATAEGTLVSGSFFTGDAIITRLGITVPVEGKGSGNFELHVPRDLDVRDGDVMTLPGSPDFIFGVIKSVQFDERDPYQTVLARTPVNVQELKFVRIVK
jgi:rod shape-determining protein MreC